MTGSPWRVPSQVADAVRQRWTKGDAWSSAVEPELQALCDKLGAHPVTVFNARYSWVVAVESSAQPLVLRASADPDAKHQAAVSLSLARLGIGPAVHEVIHTATGTWIVMDRVSPGTPLDRVDTDASTPHALTALFRPMLDKPSPDDAVPSITTWLRGRLIDESPKDLPPGYTVARPEEREHALSLLKSLGEPEGLCHGDASAGNVLLAGNNAFQVVDPRGLAGEVLYDLAVVVLKSVELMPQQTLIDTFTRNLEIDRDRLTAWIAVADAARV